MWKNEIKRINHEVVNGVECKLCSSCKEWKPLEHFTKGSKWDGFNSSCKLCQKQKRDSHLDEIHANNKIRINKDIVAYRKMKNDWRLKNREKLLARNKELYYLNHEERLKKESIYRETHKEYLKIQQSKYRKSSKGKLKYQRRRAKLLETNFNITFEQWDKIKSDFNNRCCYCGKEVELTMEHFLPLVFNGDTDINNIIPACRSCNSSKQEFDFFTWYPKKPYYSKQREIKILKYLHYDNRIQQLALTI